MPRDAASPVGAWRIGTPLVVLACGGLFVVSANNSQGTDLRPGPLHRPGLAGRGRGRQLRRAARPGRRPRRPGHHAQHGGRATARSTATSARSRALQDPAGLVAAPRPGRDDRALRRARGRHQLDDRRRQPAAGAPAGHPGRRQRAVEGRRHRRHDPGPAGRLHDRHQVRGQLRPAPGRALPAALRHPGRRRPGRAARPPSTTTPTSRPTASDAADPDISVGWDLDARDPRHRAGVRRPARPQLRDPAQGPRAPSR